ncbi:hypothetical protein Tco_1029239 [Tanacetum coccineum]|uniref:Uncharacterized protein n=1 Tax=Tanacetum coccineum TaxID=301880 RepID=A0ABQ5G4E8_9ASTR
MEDSVFRTWLVWEMHANVMRMASISGVGDEDYFAKALLDYEAEYGVPFTLRHYYENASINLNVDDGRDEEDNVQKLNAYRHGKTKRGLKERGRSIGIVSNYE